MKKPEVNAYQMAVANVARYIRSTENVVDGEPHLNIFTASEVLAIAFCKAKEEVAVDLYVAPK